MKLDGREREGCSDDESVARRVDNTDQDGQGNETLSRSEKLKEAKER